MSSAGFCGECGKPMQANEVFCGSCGARRNVEAADSAPPSAAAPSATSSHAPAAFSAAATAQPAPAPPVSTRPTPVTMPKKKHTFLKIMLLTLLGLVVIVGGIFAVTSGVFRRDRYKYPPAMSKSMAGTLTEFPIDAAGIPGRVLPTNVSTQTLSRDRTPVFPKNSLPPGVKPATLSRVGKTVTSAQYKNKPADTPVNVQVVDVSGSSAEVARQLSTEISSAMAGATITGVRLQGVAGGIYSGYKIKDQQGESYVFGKENEPTVVMINAPDAATVDIADRLARTVGNGGGLTMLDVNDAITLLPARLPEGLELEEMHTFNMSDLLSPEQLKQALGGNSNTMQLPGVSGGQLFLPNQIVTSRYRDRAGKEFNVFVGQYGSTISAWKTWLLIKGAGVFGKVESLKVHDTTGLTMSESGQQYLVFQNGPQLAAISGPAEPGGSRLVALGDSLQF
jgi:hypothetical protein